jgi:hypothetical protein
MKRRYAVETLSDWNDWEAPGPEWLNHPLHGKGEPRRSRKKTGTRSKR